jgi:MSHA biogenesis protein MshQ
MGGGGGMMGGGGTTNSSLTGFNAVDTGGGVTGVIKTKVAGTAFNLDILALQSSNTAIYTTFSGSVTVQLQDASNNSGTLNSTTGCNSSWSNISGASATASSFSSGRTGVSFNVSNAYKDVIAMMTYNYTYSCGMGTCSASVVSCSSDDFAIRPASLTIGIPSDNDWGSAGTVRTLNNTGGSGGNVHKAGQPFTLQVVAKNSGGSTTGNYSGSPTVSSLACSLPASCVNGTLTLGTWSSSSGTLTTSTASYSETGAFNLTLEDQHFADVDASDGSTTAQRYVPASASAAVGRFVPDHFDLATANTPKFKTFNSSAAGRTFTYIGQGFGYLTAPQATVTAKNAAGNATQNYTGTLWKLAAYGVVQSYAATGQPALDTSLVGTPTVTAGSNGTGTVSVNSSDVIAYVRDATTPRVPFNANISLTLSISDSSESTWPGNGVIATRTPATFNPIAFDSGNEFRYGRAKLYNAMGSELLDLPVPMEIQYWTAAGLFATNTADKFTTLTTGSFSLGNYTKGLSAANTGASHLLLNGGGVFTGGKQNLILAKPSPRATGSVDVTLNLSGAGLGYLQGNWTGAGYNQNPVARATFGVYKNTNGSIYMRENY